MRVGLGEPAGPDPRAQARPPECTTGSITTSETGSCSRSGSSRPRRAAEGSATCPAVGAQDRHPVAEPHLEVERGHELLAGGRRQRGPLAHHRPLARAATAQAHRHRLLDRLGLGWAGFLELRQAGPRGLQPGGEAVVVRRLDLVVLHQGLELGVLLVPAPGQLVEPVEPGGASLVVGREAARMGPRGVARAAEAEGHDHVRGVGQQLAIVADEQDGLGRPRSRSRSSSACPGRRGSCRAHRAAGPHPDRGTATRGRCASAPRPTARPAPGTAPGRKGTPSTETATTSQTTSWS